MTWKWCEAAGERGRKQTPRFRQKGVLTGVLGFVLLVGASALRAQSDLGVGQLRILGTGLDVSPSSQTVPVGIPTQVDTHLQAPVGSLPASVVVAAELTGPGIPGSLALTAAPNAPLIIPAQSVRGDYALTNIRLVDGGVDPFLRRSQGRHDHRDRHPDRPGHVPPADLPGDGGQGNRRLEQELSGLQLHVRPGDPVETPVLPGPDHLSGVRILRCCRRFPSPSDRRRFRNTSPLLRSRRSSGAAAISRRTSREGSNTSNRIWARWSCPAASIWGAAMINRTEVRRRTRDRSWRACS